MSGATVTETQLLSQQTIKMPKYLELSDDQIEGLAQESPALPKTANIDIPATANGEQPKFVKPAPREVEIPESQIEGSAETAAKEIPQSELELDFEGIRQDGIKKQQVAAQAQAQQEQAAQAQKQAQAQADADPRNWSSSRFKKEAPKPTTPEEQTVYDQTVAQKEHRESELALEGKDIGSMSSTEFSKSAPDPKTLKEKAVYDATLQQKKDQEEQLAAQLLPQEQKKQQLEIGPPQPDKQVREATKRELDLLSLQREVKYAKDNPGEQDTAEAFLQGIVPYSTEGKERIETLKQAHPIAHAFGQIAGLYLTAATPISRVFPAVFKSGILEELPAMARMAAGRMAQSGITFGAKELIDELALKASGGDASAAEMTHKVLGTAAFGAGLGAVGSIPSPLLRIPAEAAYGYATAKLQGSSNFEAGLNALIFGGFGLLNRTNLSREYRAATIRGFKEAMYDRLIKTGRTKERAAQFTENYFNRILERSINEEKPLTVEFLDKLTQRLKDSIKSADATEIQPEPKAGAQPFDVPAIEETPKEIEVPQENLSPVEETPAEEAPKKVEKSSVKKTKPAKVKKTTAEVITPEAEAAVKSAIGQDTTVKTEDEKDSPWVNLSTEHGGYKVSLNIRKSDGFDGNWGGAASRWNLEKDGDHYHVPNFDTFEEVKKYIDEDMPDVVAEKEVPAASREELQSTIKHLDSKKTLTETEKKTLASAKNQQEIRKELGVTDDNEREAAGGSRYAEAPEGEYPVKLDERTATMSNGAKLRRTPPGQPTVADLVHPGGTIEITDTHPDYNEKNGGKDVQEVKKYVVEHISKHTSNGLPVYSISITEPDVERNKSGRVKPNDLSYLNNLVAQDGEVLEIQESQGPRDRAFKVIEKGTPPDPAQDISKEEAIIEAAGGSEVVPFVKGKAGPGDLIQFQLEAGGNKTTVAMKRKDISPESVKAKIEEKIKAFAPTKKAPEPPAKKQKKRRVYNEAKAADRGDRATLIMAFGGFSYPEHLKGEIGQSTRQWRQNMGKLRRFLNRDSQGIDGLLQELKGQYPHLFEKYKTDSDLLSAILNGRLNEGAVKQEPDYDKILQERYEEEERIRAKAEALGASQSDIEETLQQSDTDEPPPEPSARQSLDGSGKSAGEITPPENPLSVEATLPNKPLSSKKPQQEVDMMGEKEAAAKKAEASQGNLFGNEKGSVIIPIPQGAADAIGQSAEEIKNLLHPSSSAPLGAELTREELGRSARRRDIAEKALRTSRDFFEKQPNEKNLDFIDKMETGAKQETPGLEATAKTLRDLLDTKRELIRALGKGKLQNFILNYFPHIWEDEKGFDWQKLMGAKRPLQGSKSFLKKRSIPTTREGIDAGLKPVSYNPVDLALLKLAEMDKFLTAHRILNAYKENGLAKYVAVGTEPPEGWKKIDDSISTVFKSPEIPISEAFDEGVRNQLTKLIDDLGIEHTRKPSIGGTRLGYYPWGSKKIVTKFATPDDVIAHELAHAMDYQFDLRKTMFGKHGRPMNDFILEKMIESAKKQGRYTDIDNYKRQMVMNKELKDLINKTHGPEYWKKKSKEKIAVMIQALVHAPEEFKNTAPTAYKFFTDFLKDHKQLKPLLDIKPTLRIGQASSTVHAGGAVISGYYYAQPDVARLVNNHLSPGMSKSKIFQLYRNAGNTLNQFQLGLSAFHLGFTSVDAMVSKMALAINQFFGGRPVEAIKTALKTPFAPITNILSGDRLYKAWHGEGGSQLDNLLADVMASAGGRAHMDKFYANQAFDLWKKSWKEKDILGTVFRLPFAVVDLAARPILEYVVPRQKLGVFADMIKFEMAQNPNMTHEELRTVAQKAWDSVDNRMGQMVYDNIFWNKTFKDLIMSSVRSVGWNVGTLREIGGGAKDFAGNIKALLQGKKNRLSYRTAYLIALPIVAGMLGAIYQFLRTGEPPKDAKDLYFPRTGETDNEGNPARVALPTYMKDLYHYKEAPVQTALNKLNPIISMISQMLKNKDYFGTKIRNEDDPFLKQVKDSALYLISQFEPFGFRNLRKNIDQTKFQDKTTAADRAKALLDITQPFIGITPAPYDINMTSAEKRAMEIMRSKLPEGGRTTEQAQTSKAKTELRRAAQAGDYGELRKAVSDGTITREQYRDILKQSKMSSLERMTRYFSIPEVQAVYNVANKDEKKELRSILREKIKRKSNKKISSEERAKLRDAYFANEEPA